MGHNNIIDQVEQYYTEKVRLHGATARGVDWNSPESQGLRFAQLLKVRDHEAPFTINDYGCGYGALADYLTRAGCTFRYYGFDVSPQMIAEAKALHQAMEQVTFVSAEEALTEADYTVASGIFNVKLQSSGPDWEQYILSRLDVVNGISRKAFGFNMLTKYSDPELMRSHLYYGDPLFFFDYCKTKFSRFVSVLHDYPLYEFTILVTKE